MKCPRCTTAAMEFDWSIGTMHCPTCGFKLYQDEPQPQIKPLIKKPRAAAAPAVNAAPPIATLAGQQPIKFDPPPSLDMDAIPRHLGERDKIRMRGRLQEAVFALGRGDEAEIRKAFDHVFRISDQHTDIWLHLAALAKTADEQRRCLEKVVAAHPAHPTAMRLLAELDGKLDDKLVDGIRLEEGQVPVERLVCPQCGGRLTFDEGSKEVNCAFCGYHVVDADDLARSDRQRTILEGTAKRKQAGKSWNIGQRWLHCSSCGSNITVSRQTLTNTCRFCQSNHIIQESVHHRFEQPDLIVPFHINRHTAEQLVEKHLSSGMRRLTRFFADTVERIDLHGSYLPFWVFDADMVVNWSWSNAPAHGKYPTLLSEILYLATENPPRDLCQKLEPYDLRRGVDYDQRLLAAYPAQLYNEDITSASLSVRRRLTREACHKVEPSLYARKPSSMANRDQDPGRLTTNAYTQFLTYRLALLPVWVGQLIEDDGDTQQVLVNGQTGKVTLGKLRKRA